MLDSAIDMKKVNNLYLQSLLDPDRFDIATDRWLADIKNKLKDYKSTEGLLPQVAESEIEYKKASDIKHSPLPFWLESLVEQYSISNQGVFKKNLDGIIKLTIDNLSHKVTFDKEIALQHPDTEHLSLQHNLIRKILNNINEFNPANGIPVIESNDDETSGIWSIWEISARNRLDGKVIYQPFFVADNGAEYSAYANDIWHRLIHEKNIFRQSRIEIIDDIERYKDSLSHSLYVSYQNLEAELSLKMKSKYENKINSYNFQKSRIAKIGIENIRQSKMSRLEKEHQQWLSEFDSGRKIIPGIKLLLMVKING